MLNEKIANLLESRKEAGEKHAELKKLADAAHRIADGELNVETGVRSKDEIGQVASAMERTAAPTAPAWQVNPNTSAARSMARAFSVGARVCTDWRTDAASPLPQPSNTNLRAAIPAGA